MLECLWMSVGRRTLPRDGARRMLAAALEAEVAAYVDEVDEVGRRLVVRHGHARTRQVLTSAGAVEVVAPRVNDQRSDETTGERKRFASAILPAWCRTSPQLNEVLPAVARGRTASRSPGCIAVPGTAR